MGINRVGGGGIPPPPIYKTMQKDRIILGIFIFIFVGSILEIIKGDSLYSYGFGIFVAGWSGAILLGRVMKYYSQTERDLRDMKRERERISKSKKTKPLTTKRTKLSGKKIAAK